MMLDTSGFIEGNPRPFLKVISDKTNTKKMEGRGK